jgi:type IV secretory pathway VirB10-like protein
MQLPNRPFSSRTSSGGSLVPVLIVVAALALSTAIFFLFTRKKMAAQQEAAVVAAAAAQKPANEIKAADAAKAAPVKPKMETPAVPPPPTPKPVSFGFARPLDLGKQLVRSLTSGDFATAGKLAAAADAAQSDSATKLFQQLSEMGFKPGTEDQVELLGLVENRTRIAIPFTKPGSSAILNVMSAWAGRSPRPCCPRP